MRNKFNWAERILDNQNIPRSLRALFGTGIIVAIALVIGGIVYLCQQINWNPHYVMGGFGLGCWYFIFYTACKWSDDIKNSTEDERYTDQAGPS
jgi:hypothetical protein